MQGSRTFRIFVSSTFSDLKEERNALQKFVFPLLRELCMQHGCRFQAIDLRWGISEEAGHDQQTMKICLGEVSRCKSISPRPNFIVLLGDRYGWKPLPYEIPADLFDRVLEKISPEERALLYWDELSSDDRNGWYRTDENCIEPKYILQPRPHEDDDRNAWSAIEANLHGILEKAFDALGVSSDDRLKYLSSATGQEIDNGILSVDDAEEHVFGFFRQIDNVPDLVNSVQSHLDNKEYAGRKYLDFFDDGRFDKQSFDLQQSIKQSLYGKMPGNIHRYAVSWDGSDIRHAHIGKLCKDVYEAIATVILKEIAKLKDVDDLQLEIENQRKFGEQRCIHFTGRSDSVDRVLEYIAKADNTKPLIICGEPGSGKTAVMAQAVKMAGAMSNCSTVSFYVGATPSSSDARALLSNICRQIDYMDHLEQHKPPIGLSNLAAGFQKRLDRQRDRKLIVFIDAIDQLQDIERSSELLWLPSILNNNARLVISAATDTECYRKLIKMFPGNSLVELGSMSPEDGRQLLKKWLGNSDGRRLTCSQEDLAIERFSRDPRPLYLKLIYQEARLWESYRKPASDELGHNIPEILDSFFYRLSSSANHGNSLVSHSLGYLAAARDGLSEDEIQDVLSLDRMVFRDFLKRARSPPDDILANIREVLTVAENASLADDKMLLEILRQDGPVGMRFFNDIMQRIDERKITLKLPFAVWSRFYNDIEPYLMAKNDNGTLLFSFYHTIIKSKIEEIFLNKKTDIAAHSHIATYFSRQPKYLDSEETLPNYRKLLEQPYNQLSGGLHDDVYDFYRDLRVIEAKCIARMGYDTIEDLDKIHRLDPQYSGLKYVKDAMVSSLYFINQRPWLSIQLIYNQLLWSSEPGIDILIGDCLNLLGKKKLWICSQSAAQKTSRRSEIQITFDMESTIQSATTMLNKLAIASMSGRLEIRDLEKNGERIASKNIPDRKISAISINGDPLTVAYKDIRGVIGTDRHGVLFQGRVQDRQFLYDERFGIIAVREDGSLVARQLEGNTIKVLKSNLEPPTIIKESQVADRVAFASGKIARVIYLAWQSGEEWVVKAIDLGCAPIADFDISRDGKYLLVACRDRKLIVADADCGRTIAELSYESRDDARVLGAPLKCAFGHNGPEQHALLATDQGHIGGWDWKNDLLKRLNDWRPFGEGQNLVIFRSFDRDKILITTESRAFTIDLENSRNEIEPHLAPVSACIILSDGLVLSASDRENFVKWHKFYGLAPVSQCFIRNPVVLQSYNDTSGSIVVDRAGKIYLVSPDASESQQSGGVNSGLIETVVSIIPEGVRTIVAYRSGTIVRASSIDMSGNIEVITRGNSLRVMYKVVRAGDRGNLICLYSEQSGNVFYHVSLLSPGGEEHELVVTESHLRDIAVSDSGQMICVAGDTIEIFREQAGKYKKWLEKDIPAAKVGFSRDDYLVVYTANSVWLEIYRLEDGLSLAGATDLPSEVSCLTVKDKMIAAGLASGAIITLTIIDK